MNTPIDVAVAAGQMGPGGAPGGSPQHQHRPTPPGSNRSSNSLPPGVKPPPPRSSLSEDSLSSDGSALGKYVPFFSPQNLNRSNAVFEPKVCLVFKMNRFVEETRMSKWLRPLGDCKV